MKSHRLSIYVALTVIVVTILFVGLGGCLFQMAEYSIFQMSGLFY
jgi:hypothetical protein